MSLLLGVFLLLGNAFFVGAEFAIMSARRTQIEPRAAAGSAMARTTLYAMERVSLMLAACQLGITICSLGLGAVAEPALAHLLEPLFEWIGLPENLVHPISFAIALSVVVYLHVVIGEMVPKNLAIAAPERSALLLAPPLVLVSRVLRPVIWFLNAIANVCLRIGRIEPADEVSSTYTVEQVQGIVAESRREGLIGDGRLMTEALEFTEHNAGDVMIGLDQLVTVRITASAADLEDAVRRYGFSRYPVMDEGRLVGYVHVKDVLGIGDETYRSPMAHAAIRQFDTVSVDAEVEEVLTAMQRSRSHLALVVDGPVQRGVVFLEDVFEELVGEIHDEILDTSKGRRSRR
ncbi:MAG: hemolysin family protein [Actinomycetales bacterium]